MKKKFLTILFIAFSISKLSGQLDFYIKEIGISGVNITISPISHSSDEGDGPAISIDFCLQNNSEDAIIFDFEELEIILEFRHNNKTYIKNPIWGASLDGKKITVKPHKKIEDNISTLFFLGTDIYKPLKTGIEVGDYYDLDYTKEIIEVLPTLRILLKDKEGNIKLYTNRIENIDFIEWKPWWDE